MNRAAFLLLIALGLSMQAQAQTTYRWVDQKGQVHYSDQPPPPEVSTAEARRFAASTPTPSLSYTLRKLGEDFPVALYTSANCGELCESARKLLGGRGIPFTEKVLASQDDLAAFRERFGSPEQVPTLTVGRTPFKGYEPGGWNHLLDEVGYPKTR